MTHIKINEKPLFPTRKIKEKILKSRQKIERIKPEKII